MIETLQSAIHRGLLGKPTSNKGGDYGQEMGHVFEMIVEERLRTKFIGCRIGRGIEISINGKPLTDLDVFFKFPSGRYSLVSCKARALRPDGLWNRIDNFMSDLRRQILDSAEQLRKVIENEPTFHSDTASCLIVLEADFPLVTDFIFNPDSIVGKALQGLPNPIILSYNDFDYLLDQT